MKMLAGTSNHVYYMRWCTSLFFVLFFQSISFAKTPSTALNKKEEHPVLVFNLTGIPASSPTASWDKEQIIIPLKRAGNLILVEAKTDSIQGNFILDTGAPYLVLNSTYYRDYNAPQLRQTTGVNAPAGDAAKRIEIDSLSISGIHYRNVDADIIPLGQLENKTGTKILGLLGSNLFSTMEMAIDLQHNVMILSHLQNDGQRISKTIHSIDSLIQQTPPRLQLPFKFCDDKIFLPVTIAGQQMNWILDTGAETNVVDAWRRVNLTGATGASQDVLLGIIPELTVGTTVFTMQQTIVTSMSELSETCSLYIDGILGYQFLSQGIFTINFVSKEFSLYLYNDLAQK
jgi:predicted aspartyl protease